MSESNITKKSSELGQSWQETKKIQQEKSWKKSQKHFQRKVSFIKQRKAAKYVLEKNEIEELIKENMDLETVCERIENKFQEKMMKNLKEKKTKLALETNGGAKC